MRHFARASALAAIALIVLAPNAAAQQAAQASSAAAANAGPGKDRLSLNDYLDWETVGNPQLSPDGTQIIFTRGYVDRINDRRQSAVWIMNVDGSRKRRLLEEGSSPIWSPDGTRIAFLAPGEPAGTQIWVRWMDAEGAKSQITRVTQSPSGVTWTPDGKSLSFQAQVPFRTNVALKMPSAPAGAKWVEPPRVVERLRYRADGQGFLPDAYTHLFVVSAEGGTPRQITSGDFNHSGGRWTPDGKALLFSGNRIANSEYSWRQSDIYKVDAASGTVTQLTRRNGPDGGPVPSPDGTLIAYTGNDSTDATWKDQALYVMNADGSNPRVLTPELDRSPGEPTWAADGRSIYFTVQNQGSQNLYNATLTGQVRQVTQGAHMLNVADISKTGLVIGTRSTPNDAGNIISFNLTTPTQFTSLTSVNADLLAGKKLATTEEIWYRSVDNYRIQGWIVKPPDFDPRRKYPLMLEIHGGPHSMYNVGFSFARQDHAAHGFVILYTNPRGSTGYGSAFGNAIKNAYPGKDYDDLMAGVDSVINRGYIDTNRLYVFGCSGGGVLTSWIVGHTNRFAGASANCPVTNWFSFVGTTDGASWYHNFENLPWEDPSEHLRRSPIMYVGNVKTPTQLMTGVNDLRTPMGQTEEFYEALKVMKVPARMVRFNNEWHGTSSTPSNFMRTQAFLREWFDKWQTPPARPATTQQQQ